MHRIDMLSFKPVFVIQSKTAQIAVPLPVFWERLLESSAFFRAVIEDWMFGKHFVILTTLAFNSRVLRSLDKSISKGTAIGTLLAGLFLHLASSASWQPTVTSRCIRSLDFCILCF